MARLSRLALTELGVGKWLVIKAVGMSMIGIVSSFTVEEEDSLP